MFALISLLGRSKKKNKNHGVPTGQYVDSHGNALGAELGAEVTAGVDFAKPVPAATIAAIREAMARYGVLVFRRTGLDDAAHVALASQFGDLEDHAPWIPPGQPYRLGPHTQLADGTVAPRDSIHHHINGGNALGGSSTLYADTRAAWRDLDDATREQIRGLVLCHSLWHSRKLGGPDCEPLRGIDPVDHTMGRHRLAQLHQPSGRMNLYIASHAHHVDGWTYEESRPLIDKLLRHATQDKYLIQVDWENNGDVVMWDNTCVMHRGKQGKYIGKHVRDMRRATVYDNSSAAWGLNDRNSEESGKYSKSMKDAKSKWHKAQRPAEVKDDSQAVPA
ncbi:Alpha-ketoglutarate-dependentdichlorophenoxyacetate dioxygenase [Apiospora sp. TS-2023a]